MKRYQLEQLKVNNNTYLSGFINASENFCHEIEPYGGRNFANERYLDSWVLEQRTRFSQAELNFNQENWNWNSSVSNTQMNRKVKEADLKVKELEFNIFSKSLAEMKRTIG